ncbi:uncharacterized protein LOC134819514 [Bolinopsis microptera]|uniref:uncharacterized protein LOC134819514 n=1 Tax=Bolinopsis microptera TaxID=2820187 RepID=UPI0030797B04
MIALFFVFVLLEPTLTAGEAARLKALSFGATTSDYVQFTPSSPISVGRSFTLCYWMTKPRGARSIVFHSRSGNIESGSYARVASKSVRLESKLPQTEGWFHYCLSWAAGGTQRVYFDGDEVGSISAGNDNIELSGRITLGNQHQDSKSSSHTFGGRLHKLNLFAEELSSSQIREMTEAGMCSTLEEEYESRVLKWEEVLTKQRYGNVTVFTPANCVVDLEANLNKTQTALKLIEIRLNKTELKQQEVWKTLNDTIVELTNTRARLNETLTELDITESELDEVSRAHNATLSDLTESNARLQESELKLNTTESELDEVSSAHNATLSDLTESKARLQESELKLNTTESELDEVSRAHNATLSLLEKGRRLDTVSRWDVLFTSPYLNRIFTNQLYLQLTNSWIMMEKFVGVNVTVGLVEHFREEHEEQELCDES